MGLYRSWFNIDAHANGDPTETFLFVVQKVVWRTVSPSSPSSAAFQGSMKMRGQTPPRSLFLKPSLLRFPYFQTVRQTGFCRSADFRDVGARASCVRGGEGAWVRLCAVSDASAYMIVHGGHGLLVDIGSMRFRKTVASWKKSCKDESSSFVL